MYWFISFILVVASILFWAAPYILRFADHLNGHQVKDLTEYYGLQKRVIAYFYFPTVEEEDHVLPSAIILGFLSVLFALAWTLAIVVLVVFSLVKFIIFYKKVIAIKVRLASFYEKGGVIRTSTLGDGILNDITELKL